MDENKILDCPIRKALGILGGKWKLLIVHTLRSRTYRFGELKRAVTGISEKMLVTELKRLVAAGLVEKVAYPEIPPRVEYSLSDKGKEVLPIIERLAAFGKDLKTA